MSSPPTTRLETSAEQRPRRHRTRRRARLLGLLRSTEGHPTAAELYHELRSEFPLLSLGTVYRNLEVLLSTGEIEEVPSAGREMRYDGNTLPHHHFVCEGCGDIQDVELPIPKQLGASLGRKYRLDARTIRVNFFGICSECRSRR